MKKLLLIVISFVFAGYAGLLAQELNCGTYGVSPRDVERDTVEFYFDRAYNGLLNVGKETKMFLKGQFLDSTLTNPTWTILEKPAGSTADFGATKDLDASTQLITLIPDLVGTYRIEFADGSAKDTMVINAGLYLGYETGTGCGTCHSDMVNLWSGTGHSDMLKRGLDGTLSDHYAAYCIGCHTVGYDTDAANDGFDDFPFVFPDTLFVGQYDNMVAQYPDAMARANIQCESCHGPGSEHMAVISDSKMVTDISTDNCAWCHDSGTHHVYPEQWDYSRHANMEHPYTRSSCAPCHNGMGFIEFVKGGKQGLQEDMPYNSAITCATCHDPHNAENGHQLRTLENELGNGLNTWIGGYGILCMNCHKSRRNAEEYVQEYHDHYGPHHGPQADMLYGTNVITWGQTLPNSAHLNGTENSCVDCHMAEGHADEEGNVILAGSHSFSMKFPDGTDNVESCAPCHGEIGEEFSDKKFFYNGHWADLDGNGVAEGLQIEIENLLDMLGETLPPVGDPAVEVDTNYTLLQREVAYNYFFVEEDRSLGVHNPAFAYSLLKLSLEQMGIVLGVPGEGNLPTEYGLEQNYPNPFNPSTTIEFSLPVQSDVSILVYDALGNEVGVVFEGPMSAGVHQVNWNAQGFSSGVYFYRMQANDFVQVRKMILMK